MSQLIRIKNQTLNLDFLEYATRKQGVSIFQPETGKPYLANEWDKRQFPEKCHNGTVTELWMNHDSEELVYRFYDEEGEILWKYLYDNSELVLS